MRKKIFMVFLSVIMVVLLAACSISQVKPDSTEGNNMNEDEKQPQVDDQETKSKDERIMITLYFGDLEGMGLEALDKEIRLDGRGIEMAIVEELIKGPDNEELVITIPEETKLLSIKIENGIAYVNFSKEFKENHWGGSYGDAITLNSIVLSLTELDSINKVQLLLDGNVEEAILGHVFTGEPLERDESIIIR